MWRRVEPRVLRAANRIEDALDAALFRFHSRRGWRIPLRILPYLGFGTPDRVFVRGRVVRDRGLPHDTRDAGVLGTLLTAVRRYATHEIPGAEVRVRHGDEARITQTDREGFIELWWDVAAKLEHGRRWLTVELDLLSPQTAFGQAHEKAEVLVVPPDADFGVISDIDDTVLVMGARHPLRKFRGLFLMSAHERVPFEGVAAFYRALQAGRSGGTRNPIFYVSSSPWNVYEHLREFFDLHDIPKGPLFLRDWGITEKGVAPDGRHEHKLEHIHLLLEAFPDLRFILIGDSGQQDAELYEQVCRRYPGRILAVYIRDVVKSGKRDAPMKAVAASLAELGVPFCLAADSEVAAQHAATLGLISWRRVDDVAEDRDKDKRGSDTV